MNKANEQIIDSDVPKWITQEYIENILKNYYNDQTIKIINFYSKLVIEKGANYGSLITSVIVEYESFHEKYSIEKLIIKSSFDELKIVYDKIKEYRAFDDELLLYNNVLPKMQILLESMNLNYTNNNDLVFPKSIYCDFDREAIVLTDLTPLGYKLADRIKGLDKMHTKLALKKIATFHACSILMNELEPGCFKKFDHGMFNHYTTGIYAFYLNTVKKICDILKSLSGEFINYSEKIRKLIPHWIEKSQKCFDPKSNQLNVLAHGDFWTNNIMYKYNDCGEPIGATLIDFQYSIWASPSVDLHYFFHTSLAGLPDINEMENYVKFYHDQLIFNLKEGNYKSLDKIPNFEKFLDEFWANGFHALQAAFLNKSVSMLEDTSAASPEALFCIGEESNKFQNVIISNKRVQEHWKILVPFFDKKGLLEI